MITRILKLPNSLYPPIFLDSKNIFPKPFEYILWKPMNENFEKPSLVKL
jgi:hypothetical protein